MSVLAARIPFGGSDAQKLTGQVHMNGKPRDEARFRSISAYVMQDDYMFANLTVFETLLLAAHFFLPTEMTREAKENHVRKHGITGCV